MRNSDLPDALGRRQSPSPHIASKLVYDVTNKTFRWAEMNHFGCSDCKPNIAISHEVFLALLALMPALGKKATDGVNLQLHRSIANGEAKFYKSVTVTT